MKRFALLLSTASTLAGLLALAPVTDAATTRVVLGTIDGITKLRIAEKNDPESLENFSRRIDKHYRELQETEAEWTLAQEYLLLNMTVGRAEYYKAMIYLGMTLPIEERMDHNRLLVKAKKANDFEAYLLQESRAILRYNEAIFDDEDAVLAIIEEAFEKVPEARERYNLLLEEEESYQ